MTDSTHLRRPCNPKEPPEPDNFPDVSLHGKGGGKHPDKKDRGRSGSVSQILSTGQSRLCGHFSHAVCSEAFRAPVRLTERVRLIPGDPAGRQPFPCLSCIARGLPCLLGRPRSGELLPPLFTLARMGMNSIRAVCFLWHFPSGNPWEVPVSRFHGTRCLVMSGLSSTPVRRPEQRPPEPDRHGLHTLSAARGKAQSRQGGHFCSLTCSHPGLGNPGLLQARLIARFVKCLADGGIAACGRYRMKFLFSWGMQKNGRLFRLKRGAFSPSFL